MADDPMLPYAGTAGFVARDTSRELAEAEAESGVAASRGEKVLAFLWDASVRGATWQEVAKALSLHHGQASGALSVLHKSGLVFQSAYKRNRCHPYVHGIYRHHFAEEERYDDPVKTGRNRKRDAGLHASADAVTEVAEQLFLRLSVAEERFGLTVFTEACADARNIINLLDKHRRTIDES